MNAAAPFTSSGIKPRTHHSKAELDTIRHNIVITANAGTGMTVRHLFYRLVSAGVVEKTEAGYSKIQTDRVLMRRRGELPYGWLAGSTRAQRNPVSHSSIDAVLEDIARLYRKSQWADADGYVEVWLEKDALAGVGAGAAGHERQYEPRDHREVYATRQRKQDAVLRLWNGSEPATGMPAGTVKETIVASADCPSPTLSGRQRHRVCACNSRRSTWQSPTPVPPQPQITPALGAKPQIDRDGSVVKDPNGKSKYLPIIKLTALDVRDRWSAAVVEVMRVAHPEVFSDGN